MAMMPWEPFRYVVPTPSQVTPAVNDPLLLPIGGVNSATTDPLVLPSGAVRATSSVADGSSRLSSGCKRRRAIGDLACDGPGRRHARRVWTQVSGWARDLSEILPGC